MEPVEAPTIEHRPFDKEFGPEGEIPPPPPTDFHSTRRRPGDGKAATEPMEVPPPVSTNRMPRGGAYELPPSDEGFNNMDEFFEGNR